MFGEPGLYALLRQEIVPRLRTYPTVRVWHPSCAAGEEVYAMAILLREERLYRRAWIWGTDADEALLARARAGQFDGTAVKTVADRYRCAGGRGSFTEYHRIRAGQLVMRPLLRKRVTFAQHHLATDASFNEFQLIVCRDDAFADSELARRAFSLFHDSLCHFGGLWPGNNATVRALAEAAGYRAVGRGEIYLRRG